MKRLLQLLILLILCTLSVPIWAQSASTMALLLGANGATAPPAYNAIGTAFTTGATNITFSGKTIPANSLVLLGASINVAGAITATANGVSCNLDKQSTPAFNANETAVLFSCYTASGYTGNLVISWTGSQAGIALASYFSNMNTSSGYLDQSQTATPLSNESYASSGTGGVFSFVYNSGLTVVGTVGQTCNITVNGGNNNATFTLALTGTNTVASGTAGVLTANGTGYIANYGSASASFSASAGTATSCTTTTPSSTIVWGVPTPATTQAVEVVYGLVAKPSAVGGSWTGSVSPNVGTALTDGQTSCYTANALCIDEGYLVLSATQTAIAAKTSVTSSGFGAILATYKQ